MKYKLFFLPIIAFALFSCKSPIVAKPEAYVFKPLDIPTMYKGDQLRAMEYLITNYWKNFLDSSRIANVIEYKKSTGTKNGVLGADTLAFEEAFGNYSYYMNMIQPVKGNIVANSMRKLIKSADDIALRGDSSLMMALLNYSEKYFYDANSPVLNEEIYIPALEEIMSAKSISDIDKMQYEWQLKTCKVNRVGQEVGNFAFRELTSQNKYRNSNLHSIKADYTLIFFNNPDCPTCSLYKTHLKEHPLIQDMINSGKMKVLSMFTDEDVELWRSRRMDFPTDWIYAYDPDFTIRENNFFAVRAVPSLYLLDKDKKTILKDADPNKLSAYLESLANQPN